MVCVRPQEAGRDIGIRMRRINYFYFFREDTFSGIPIQQDAIVDGSAAPSGLSNLYCSAGYSICHFESILRADFYVSPGEVKGAGEAILQFGRGPDPNEFSVSPRSRRLSDPSKDVSRNLSNGSSGIGQKASIDMSFSVTNNDTFQAASGSLARESLVGIAIATALSGLYAMLL